MSGTIYDNVIETETKGINRERVEMTVEIYESADCVRDHDFRTETNTHQPLQCTGSDSVKIRSSRSAVVCLVLLCVLLLTAVIVLCVHIHTNNTNYTEERDQLLITIKDFKTVKNQLEIQNNNLTIEKKELLWENNDLQKHLHEICQWTYYQSSIYFISSEKKTWTESRRYCMERGADLIIINNKEEQDLVKKMSVGADVWIGLSDNDEEGTWKWVDGSTLTSGFSFWGSTEPNGHRRENCVLSSSSGWADYPCHSSHKFQWICEKSTVK